MRARAYLLALLSAPLSLSPLADAILPDPLWIAGVYDGGDYDDSVATSAGAPARSAGRSDHAGLPPVPLLAGLRAPAAGPRLLPPVDAGVATMMTAADTHTRAPPSWVTQA
jgi:hypothetical protein